MIDFYRNAFWRNRQAEARNASLVHALDRNPDDDFLLRRARTALKDYHIRGTAVLWVPLLATALYAVSLEIISLYAGDFMASVISIILSGVFIATVGAEKLIRLKPMSNSTFDKMRELVKSAGKEEGE